MLINEKIPWPNADWHIDWVYDVDAAAPVDDDGNGVWCCDDVPTHCSPHRRCHGISSEKRWKGTAIAAVAVAPIQRLTHCDETKR